MEAFPIIIPNWQVLAYLLCLQNGISEELCFETTTEKENSRMVTAGRTKPLILKYKKGKQIII